MEKVFSDQKKKFLSSFPYQKEYLKPATELKSIFERCHNYIYANEGLLKEKIFNEILKLIFIKMADEKSPEPRSEFYINKEELRELKETKQSEFIDRISALFDKVKIQYSDVFQYPKERIILNPLTIGYIVNELQVYSLTKTPIDIKGTAFQTFVHAQQRGERGEFFTPATVVELAVKILDLKDEEKFIDPACGSGGFLISGMEQIKGKFIKQKPLLQNEADEYLINYARKYVCGIDINQDVARISKMQMVLCGDGHAGIFTANSLLPFKELESIAKESGLPNELSPLKESFDVLMTNPPFGTKGKITESKILINYDLGHKWTKEGGKWRKTDKLIGAQAPEVLFIERSLQFLKNSGRLAIVIPNGILENPSQGYIREYIKSKAKILAIINLPAKTFIPYGSGINASVLFLQKLSDERLNKEINKDYDIFFAASEKIGYEGSKNGKIIYKRDANGNIITNSLGDPIMDEDITDICKAYMEGKKTGKFPDTNYIFIRKYSEIEDRLDQKYYQPQYKKLKEKLIKMGAVPLEKVAKIITRKADILKNPEATIKYVELNDVNAISSELTSSTEMKVYEAPSRARYEIKEGNIITAVAGNSTGTKKHVSAYVRKEFDGCICTNGFSVLIPTIINPFYLLFYLKNEEFLKQMYQYRTGAAIPALSDSDLKKVLILVPEKEIQQRIGQKIKEIYKLREKSLKVFNELKEYMNKIMSTCS